MEKIAALTEQIRQAEERLMYAVCPQTKADLLEGIAALKHDLATNDLREAVFIVEYRAGECFGRGSDWLKLCRIADYLRRQYESIEYP